MSKDILEKLRMIFNHFGLDNQEKKLEEEMLELLESGEDEEYADVWVLAMQLYIARPKIRKIAEEKIDRTLFRITEDYYIGEIL